MGLPPTSKIGFLDQSGNGIDGPLEWIPALVEVYVKPQDWERVRLIRQSNEELLLSLRRLGGNVRIIATWPPSAAGHFRLTLHFDDKKLEEQIITIQPRKITTAAYTQLLEDLEMRLPATIALGLQRNGALAGIKIHPPGESTRVMELARLRRAINGDSEHMGLAQVLNNLATDPQKILLTTELWVPRERARRPHPSGLTQAMSRPYNLDKHGIPVRLLDTRVEHSVDVYENRLVKAYVRLVDLHLGRLSHILESRSTKTMLEEVLKLRDILSIARRNATFLDDVTLPSYLPTQSTMVLIKRPAYLAALEGYLEFHKSPEVYLEEPLLEAPLENLPFLYQIWGTLEVLYVLLDITGTLGYEVKLQQLTKKEVDGIFIQLLPNGKPMLILEHPNTGTVIRVIPECAYTSQGQFRSISFTQRPDIAIEILPPQGPPNIYLFDPKYKLESERQEEGQGNGKPKKEDIDKMHTYRDAIRGEKGSIVVQYAAIMYPGTYQSYEAGIEALQAYPGLEGLLEDRLKEIFSAALRA